MFKRVLVAALILNLFSIDAHSQELWTAKDGSIRNIDTKALFVNGSRMYLATKNELYASSPKSGKWESIFFIPSGDNEISCVGGNYGNLLVGTRRGLFRSQDLGKTWSNVFRTIIPDKSNILSLDVPTSDSSKLLIGTKAGIFTSDDNGARWRDISGNLKNRQAKCLAIRGENMYVGADDGLYLSHDLSGNWQRVFIYSKSMDTGETPEESQVEEPEDVMEPGINCIAVRGSDVYAAAPGKILHSNDLAKGWDYLPTTGLHGRINYILASRLTDKLYCATTKGVYELLSGKDMWNELYKVMYKAVNVKNIAFAGRDEKAIWASTDRGLYKLEVGAFVESQYIDVERNLKSMKVAFDQEPTFKELQMAAMKFNDVSPDKINRWKTQAQIRALAPKVSVGFDNSKSNTYEIYTSATKDYVIAGPDDISEGFDISVSWDLANVIWSDDQTSIDTRSRLTTQLRNDILDDLRRSYFERRRLQYELMASPPADMKLRFEKELRIDELTQAIDDITGNYLSTHVKK